MNGRPNDERHFVHKKILGGISTVAGLAGGFIPGASTLSAITSRLAGRRAARTSSLPAVPGNFGTPSSGGFSGGARRVLAASSLAATGCPDGFELDADGRCAKVGVRGAIERFLPGGRTGFAEQGEFGEAQVGRFGAGLEPAVRSMETRMCPRGTVLGIDGLCYNKRDLRNTDRFWPRGRRPLLTGGEMRCIGIAARAAGKIRTKTKQLQKLGMLPKPTRRAAPRRLAAGHHAHVEHD